MKATVSIALFCGGCRMSLEHATSEAGAHYVRCTNARCEHVGKKWAAPTLELLPLDETKAAVK